jgi:hypothetical protein
MGHRAAQGKNRNRSRNPGTKPVPETRTENPDFPVLETRTTGSVRKSGLLSISRGGGRSSPESVNGNLPMDGTVRLVLAKPEGPPRSGPKLQSRIARRDLAFRGVEGARNAMAAQGHSTQSQNGGTGL